MSKSGRAAYKAQAFQQWNPERLEWEYVDMLPFHKEEEKKVKDQDIEQRITALEEANAEPFFGDTYADNVLRLARLRRDAVALTKYLRENGYPKQPEPTQLEDIPF